MTPNTIPDLMNNTPGQPVRVNRIDAITAIQGGQVNFPLLDAMEYMNTVSEQRSGVSRSAMGLNPDTLHDTARGMMSMMSAAQTRIRFIARTFAETGMKDLFLGVHDCLRANATSEQTVRLRKQFIPINPATWAIRDNMEIEIGNAGGRDYDLAALTNIMEIQAQAVQAQGGLDGALVTPKHLLHTFQRIVARSGLKNGENYMNDPATYQPAPPSDPMASPEAMKVQAELQGKLQVEQVKVGANQQAEANRLQWEIQKAQQEMQLAAQKAQAEFALREQEMGQKHQIEIMKIQAELEAKQRQLDAEISTREKIALMEVTLKQRELAQQDENEKLAIMADAERADLDREVNLNIPDVHIGGDPG
jgi:hypothetical protein